ncbi:MAG: hypothetical protein ACJ8G4_08500 [Burkholderiales bacterium]
MNVKALLWIPALWALAFDWYAGPFSFTPAYLAIPIAACLGQRYGRRALWLVGLGGLPCLPPLESHAFVSLASALDVYAVALVVCALAADERPLAERVPRFGLPLLAAALAALPWTIWFYGFELGEVRIAVVFGFTAMLWLLLFLFGWRAFPARQAVAALALAAAAGLALDAIVPGVGRHLSWDYRLDSPAACLMGIAYFAAGRLWSTMLRTRASPLSPGLAHALVLAVAAVALGYTVNRAALTAIGFEAHLLPRWGYVLGAPLGLPLAGLLGGLLAGRRGIAVAVLAVPVFWALDALALSGFRLPVREFAAQLHQPLAVLAFGLLGLALRGRALGTERRLYVARIEAGSKKIGVRALRPRDDYA